MGRPGLVGVTAIAGALFVSLSCSRSEPPSPEAPLAPPPPHAAATPIPADVPEPPCAGQTPCTMQLWMKGAFARELDTRDFRALRSALMELSHRGPPGYANWASIARDGSEAAAVEDGEAVTASCRGCHAQYVERYKREIQGKPL